MEEQDEKRMHFRPFTVAMGIAAQALIILVSGFIGYRIRGMMEDRRKPKVTSSYLESKISEASDLTSAELSYDGLLEVTEGKIPFITEKGFSMRYTAKIRSGINVSDVKISVSDEEVIVTVPRSDVQSVYVDPESIEFFDKKFALFNWSSNYDVVDAIAAAEDDAIAHTELINELNQKADQQTESVLRGLLEDAVGERELTFKFVDGIDTSD